MAGDLYIETLNDNFWVTLKQVGATAVEAVYHANRPWTEYQGRLNDPKYGSQGRARSAPDSSAPAQRVNLPAHAYINFEAANRDDIRAKVAQGDNRQQLASVLSAVSRPLGLISNKAALADWQTSNGDQRVTLLLNALEGGTIILEYYKINIASVLVAFSSWQKYNEQG